jgi:hypothetical protein
VKPKRQGVVLILVLLMMWVTGGTVWAAVSWVTDAKTGIKIGWQWHDYTLTAASWSGPAVDGKAEGKGVLRVTVRDKAGKELQEQGEVEMVAGLLEGRGVLKGSDGGSYEGDYKAGLYEGKGTYKWSTGQIYDGDWKNGVQNGKGIYKWANGDIYEGDWLNGKQEGKGSNKLANGNTYDGDFKDGQPHGYGIGKQATGEIIHDGEWKYGLPSTPQKADKVLGIPWGATDEQARNIMKQRPNTKAYSFMNGKNANDQWKGYYGPYADFSDAEIFIHFHQDKMWQVQVSWALKEDQVLERFNAVKQGLTERYGAPASEKGKYLDSLVLWDLGGGYSLNVQIRKNTLKYIAGADPSLTHPFRVFITYYNQVLANSMGKPTAQGGSKDY